MATQRIPPRKKAGYSVLRRDAKTYAKVVEAYRRWGANHTAVAKQVGCTWRTAKNAYEFGWKEAKLPPIQRLLEQEQIEARAALGRERNRELEAKKAEDLEAREQAVQARKEEGAMVRATRGATIQSMAAVVELAKACRSLSTVINERMEFERFKIQAYLTYEKAYTAGQEPEMPKFKRPAMSLSSLVDLLNKSAGYSTRIIHNARQAMDMERIHLGQPTHLVGVVDERVEVSLEELEARQASALQAIEGARAVGGLKVIDGGKSDPVVGERVIIQ